MGHVEERLSRNIDRQSFSFVGPDFTPLENAPRLAAWSGSVRVRGPMPRASSLTGFTLIEMLVVMGAIAIFTTMAMVAFGAVRSRQRDAQRMANMDQLAKAMELYVNANSKYPTQCGGLVVSTCDLSTFLPGISSLKDPSKPVEACDPADFESPCEYAFGQITDDDYVVYFSRECKLDPGDASLCYQLKPDGLLSCP